MLSHWDDVPWTTLAQGDLRAERQRLQRAAAPGRVSLSRYRIEPGRRPMPQHVHVEEEEIFFVLAGSGLSWQDGATHEIRAGDALVHRAQAEAHTVIAADDEPLEVLAFASGARLGLTTLPRAGVMWVGGRWWPPDAPHPFAAEPPLRDGEPPPLQPRPPTIVALGDVAPVTQTRGPVDRTARDLARAAGSVRSGLRHLDVAPGGRSSVRHCHSLEEELFVVLGGDGMLLLGDDEHPVQRGSIVSRPPGTGIAHAFQAGPGGLQLLAYGTRDPGDVCWYPDSRKLSWRGAGVIARVEPLDYWDGEE